MRHTRRTDRPGLLVLGLAILTAASLQTPSIAAPKKMVTLSGTLSCLGCDLKKAHGAGAQCSIYGHKHSLKTGNGKYYTFLENAKSEPLIKGEEMHGKKVRVHGALFPGTQVIEVMNYRALK